MTYLRISIFLQLLEVAFGYSDGAQLGAAVEWSHYVAIKFIPQQDRVQSYRIYSLCMQEWKH